jgi:hypothetical protein
MTLTTKNAALPPRFGEEIDAIHITDLLQRGRRLSI